MKAMTNAEFHTPPHAATRNRGDKKSITQKHRKLVCKIMETYWTYHNIYVYTKSSIWSPYVCSYFHRRSVRFLQVSYEFLWLPMMCLCYHQLNTARLCGQRHVWHFQPPAGGSRACVQAGQGSRSRTRKIKRWTCIWANCNNHKDRSNKYNTKHKQC